MQAQEILIGFFFLRSGVAKRVNQKTYKDVLNDLLPF